MKKVGFWEKKYQFRETSKTKEFHAGRRMFAIINGKVEIAPENVPWSHAEWFEREGWISKERHESIDKIVRGFADERGLFFYTHFDFQVGKEAEKEFFAFLKEIKESLGLKGETKVFGGIKKQDNAGLWPPRKEFGTIGELLEK